ncbi:phosphatidate cytidylyltransferase [Micromonospora sediminicola]|uniref:phosphatidate cytidylyltransferase n=1 Tax=Micromonospora sediminicola TaxID=946078 RepID=UPI0037BD52B6
MPTAALGSAVALHLLWESAPYVAALFGVAIALVLGDLTESALNRRLAIKDTNQFLSRHGALMDLLDSILFALPTALGTVSKSAVVPELV